VRAGGWVVRGGVAAARRCGRARVHRGRAIGIATAGVAAGVRGHVRGQPAHDAREATARAAGFAGRSPGFLVAVARLLALRVGASSRVRLVALTDPAPAPLAVDVARR